MLDNLEIDDSESPAIGLAPAGVAWDEVLDHLKISHAPLIVPGDDGEFTGTYWADSRMVRTGPLGPDPDEAVTELRLLLHERGEA